MLPVECAGETETADVESAGDCGAVAAGNLVGDLTTFVDGSDALDSAYAGDDYVA